MIKRTANNNVINATLNGFITVFIVSSVGWNSFRFTNFVSYAVNNDVLFAYDVTL